MSGKSKALGLYMRILRAHRQRLPYDLRAIGDKYVSEEFKKHKKADAKWLPNFYREWNSYVDMLEAQGGVAAGEIGRDLAPDQLGQMNDEQKQQLAQLKMETDKLYKDS